MFLHGREVGFKLTIGAAAKVAALCPDGDLNRISELFAGGYAKTIDALAAFIAAMSDGYEQARRFEEPGYQPQPLTADEVLCLSPDELGEVQAAAMAAFTGDQKPKIEIEAEKKTAATAD